MAKVGGYERKWEKWLDRHDLGEALEGGKLFVTAQRPVVGAKLRWRGAGHG